MIPGFACATLLMAELMTTDRAQTAGGFKLPASATRILSNGVRVHVMEYHELPLVDLHVVIAAGAAQDPAGKEGLADLVAGLLRKGAAARSAQEVAEAVDFVGGSLEASADPDGTRVTAEFMVKDLDLGLELLGDALMRPAFTTEEIERLKGETIAELKAARENPSLLASRRFLQILYGDHPYAHPTPGYEESVASITPEDVHRFYKGNYTPDAAIVVAVGDFKAEEMFAKLEKTMGPWTGRAAAPAPLPAPAPPRARSIHLINKPDQTQSQIRIGGIGIKRTDPDYPAVQVANTILGGGFTSRLVEEIRVNRGLSYGVSSRFIPLVHEGPFMIVTFTKNATTLETTKVALQLLEKFRKDGPTEEEVDKARRYLRGNFAIGHQSPDSMAAVLAEMAFFDLPRDYYDTYLDRIAAVGVDDVKRVATAKFPFEHLSIVVLGQAAAVKKDLETLGPVASAPLTAR